MPVFERASLAALSLAALLAIAPGCDGGKPASKAKGKSAAGKTAKVEARETIGKTTQNVLKLEDELAQGARLAATSIDSTDYLSQLPQAYRTSVAKIASMNIGYAIQLHKAQSISADSKPLSYDEFLAQILKKGQPDGIQLPMLPYYQEYAYDEPNERLVVVEYPARKEQFEKEQGIR